MKFNSESSLKVNSTKQSHIHGRFLQTPTLLANNYSRMFQSHAKRHLLSIFCGTVALALKADKSATKSLKFSPSAILSNLCKHQRITIRYSHNISTRKQASKSTNHRLNNYMRESTWESGFIANSGTDKNSSVDMNPLEFLSSWQNLLYRDTISCWVTMPPPYFQEKN